MSRELMIGDAERRRRLAGSAHVRGKDAGATEGVDWDFLVDGVRSRTLDGFLQGVGQLWLALSPAQVSGIGEVMAYLRQFPVKVKLAVDLTDPEAGRKPDPGKEWAVLDIHPQVNGPMARALKRLEDIIIGSAIFLMIFPLMLFLSVGVKLSSPGPVFFRQKRQGLNCEEIEVWKFRSMRVHQEEKGKVTQARKDDPRVTPFGAFLRRTSLDELPQFINVLQGKMSIVGPRPHAIAHGYEYMGQVDGYILRHRVKPGITGWAQVNGWRGETDTLEKMQGRIRCDLHYIDNWSLWLDIRIILLTLFKGFVGKNAY